MSAIESKKDLIAQFEESKQECKKDTRTTSYCFTINNYTDDEYNQILADLKSYDYYVIGKEVSSTGTPHLQGFVFNKNAIRFSSLQKQLKRAAIFITRARGEKFQNAWKYCMKEGDFIEHGERPSYSGKRNDLKEFMETVDGGCRKKLNLMKEHPQVYAKFPNFVNEYLARTHVETMQSPDIVLREWQNYILDYLKEDPIDRSIIWIWSNASLTGKTTFMKYVASQYKDAFLSTDDLNKKNILCAYEEQKIVHIDLTRDLTPEQRNYLKSTLESLSDQKLQFSGKYNSCMKYVKAHIVVTANQPPVGGLPYRYFEFEITTSEPYTRTDWRKKHSSSAGAYYQRVTYYYNIPMQVWSEASIRVLEDKYFEVDIINKSSN